MSKHWTENYNLRHRNHMWGEGLEVIQSKDEKLDPNIVYFVQVCSFTFEFHNLAQIETCLQFYSTKTRKTSRIPNDELSKLGGDHWEVQRWFEKLPMKFQDNHYRPKIVKALEKALVDFRKKERTNTLS